MTPRKERLELGASGQAVNEKQRTQRVVVRVPLTLEMTISGQVIKTSAQTVAVNTHGAMVLCPRSIGAVSKLEIINERTRERVAAKISRAPRESPEGYLFPLEFEKPVPMFWQISFPPSNWKPGDF